MLASASECRPAIAAHKGMEKLLEQLLSHESTEVRERGGGVVRELARDATTKSIVQGWTGVCSEVRQGLLARDDTTRAREAYKALFGTDRPT